LPHAARPASGQVYAQEPATPASTRCWTRIRAIPHSSGAPCRMSGRGRWPDERLDGLRG
jgi:hypothetical protein